MTVQKGVRVRATHSPLIEHCEASTIAERAMKPKKKVRQGLAIFLVMVLELANCIFEGLYGEYGLVALLVLCQNFISRLFFVANC